MVLFFDLNVCQKFSDTRITDATLPYCKWKKQFFCSDTVCCKETVRFLIFGRCHAVGSSRVIIFSITVVAVAWKELFQTAPVSGILNASALFHADL